MRKRRVPGKEFQIFIVFAAILAVQTLLTALGGGLYFTAHEADMIHLTDLVLRQSGGEVFHSDVATPIGGWATLPMALLHRAGFGLGQAMVWGQIIVATSFLPFLTVAVASRLTLGQSFVFGAVALGLVTGFVYGGTEPLISFSMHYNRWCWAAALTIALVVLLPARTSAAPADGIVIGGLMAAMAMVKISYPVALVLPVVFGLLRNGRTKTFLAACATAFVILFIVTAVEGLDYWRAYIGDLLAVAGSSNRAAPGADWPELVLSPRGAPATLAVLALIYFGARLGRRDLGATLILFFAAFTAITWQNYGNDPVWLCVVAMVAWGLSTQGQGSAARALRVTSMAAAVTILPVMLNILWSPVRHLTSPEALSQPVLAEEPGLRMVAARGDAAFAKITLIAAPDTQTRTFRGEALADCDLTGGLIAVLRRDAQTLTERFPDLDRQPLVADLFQAHWLFADLSPLSGGTPWYYDGLPGLADATHVLLPDCPADHRARDRVIALLDEAEVPLEKVGDGEGFRLYRIGD